MRVGPRVAIKLRRFLRRVEAVTPVVGTLLVLAITVLGITAVMFWGAPAIQRIQDDNSQAAMINEFVNLQEVSTTLQVPDASRDPRVTLGAGAFGLQEGTRFLVTANRDDGTGTVCDLDVTGWSDPSPAPSVTVTANCDMTDKKVEVHRVTGANTVRLGQYDEGLITPSPSVDFASGNWMFRVTDGAATSPVVYAQAWLLSSDQVVWRLQSSVGERSVHLDGGAVFSQSQGTVFLEKNPRLHEGASGTEVFAFFLRTHSAEPYTEISGQAGFRVFVGLVTQSARIAQDDVQMVRFTFDGDLAESWCNALLLRNNDLTGAAYALPPGVECADEDTPSVTYQKDPIGPFPFHLIHGDIRTSIVR